jgi:hypothetical protein
MVFPLDLILDQTHVLGSLVRVEPQEPQEPQETQVIQGNSLQVLGILFQVALEEVLV